MRLNENMKPFENLLFRYKSEYMFNSGRLDYLISKNGLMRKDVAKLLFEDDDNDISSESAGIKKLNSLINWGEVPDQKLIDSLKRIVDGL